MLRQQYSGQNMGSTFHNMLSDPSTSPEVAAAYEKRKEGEREMLTSFIKSWPDHQLIEQVGPMAPEPCPRDPVGRANWLVVARDTMISFSLARLEAEEKPGHFSEVSQESTWYTQVKVFIPPTELCKRHSNFQKYWRALQDANQNTRKADIKRMVKQVCNS